MIYRKSPLKLSTISNLLTTIWNCNFQFSIWIIKTNMIMLIKLCLSLQILSLSVLDVDNSKQIIKWISSSYLYEVASSGIKTQNHLHCLIGLVNDVYLLLHLPPLSYLLTTLHMDLLFPENPTWPLLCQ